MSDLHDPEVRPLWQAIRDRFVVTGDLMTIKSVTVPLSAAGLARINGWLARAGPRKTRLTITNNRVSVPVHRVLAALGPTVDLASILRDTVGMPEVVQPRRRIAAMKSDFWSYAQAALPDTPHLLQHLRAGGLSETLADERLRLINALARARQILPLDRPVPLPRMSYYCSRDPHYFDLNPPGLGPKLVLLAAEILGEPVTPVAPNERFALLVRAGVYPDRLSTTVLTLNITAIGDGPVDDALRAAAACRRPLHLSLYDLTVYSPRISNKAPITVVENPSVVEEALTRGYQRPLACTSGALSAVDHQFLTQLASDRVPIHYSGDCDPAGSLIAEVVRARFGAKIIMPTGGKLAVNASDVVVYQEDEAYLDLLLGPDPSDPFGTSLSSCGTLPEG
ncbi:DUF2399 domain-containing protein [Micromonospora sp. NPDC048170]|uniref:DUF2399 domain-containing protein n=1 Tax=Micromonospora sp. NPDC048170 TaxID=3154819 RepID=UPI0033C8CA93